MGLLKSALIAGWMMRKVIKMRFTVPKKLKEKFPWLTEQYVKDNAFAIAPDDWLKENPNLTSKGYFGEVPCKKRSEIQREDIIIFKEFENADRFLVVTSRLLEEIKDDSSPVGVIVHPP